MLTALALTYVYAEKYESYTAISYRVQEVTRFKPQQNEAMGSPAPQAPFKVIGSTLQEVLKSDAILLDVVKSLKLDVKEAPDYSGPWYRSWYRQGKDWVKEYGGKAWKLMKHGRVVDEDPVAGAIQELRANIKVSNRDSYIFHLYVRDRYPERAARITDHLSDVLARWLLDYDRQPGRYRADQLEQLIEAKHSELERRRTEIEELLGTHRVASVQLETERLTENLTSLQLELSRLSSDIARAQTRQAEVQAKLATKQRILGNGAPSAEPVEFIPPEDFRKLASQRVFDEVDLKSMLAKRDALQGSIDSIATRLRKLPEVQARLDSLKLALTSTEREFALLKDGYSEAAVRATSPMSEVRVLHPAVVPANPASPIKVYHVLLAGVLALLLAIGLVYTLDFLGAYWLLAPPPEPPVPVLTESMPAGPPEGPAAPAPAADAPQPPPSTAAAEAPPTPPAAAGEARHG